ncbi:MAG: hypothetical protein Kow0089_07850 [Desulfobulbaceae bacterium]
MKVNSSMETYLKIAAALNDPTRLMILKFLQEHGDTCVCEMQHSFGLGQSRLSRHLKILKEAGLIDVERKGALAFFYVHPTGTMEKHFLSTLDFIDVDLPDKIHFDIIKKKATA